MKRKNTFKKFFCVILAVAVFAVSIPFTAIAANPSEVDFAILSDIHYYASTAMGNSDADRKEFREMMYLNNSTSGIAPELTEAAMANVTAMALAGQIDFLLLPGDLTRNAEYSAHEELVNRLKVFEATTGVPVYVINGNHDINNQRAMYYNGEETVSVKDAPEMRDQLDTTPEEFEALYKDFGYSAEPGKYYSRYKATASNSEGSLSYATDINDDYRLIAIDSQLYSADNTDSGENEQETAGHVSDALLEWTLEECAKAKADGKTIIGMTHTNAIPHFETEVDLFDNFVLRSWDKFADAVADAGMHYIVSGHVHMQDIATYVSDNGEQLTDIVTTSLLSYPNQFRTVSLETTATGNTSLSYNTHDVDEYVPVMIDGVAQPKPFKYLTWAYNFGGTNIKSFVLNILEYELTHGFGKDVKDAGGLYNYLSETIGIKELLAGLVDNEMLGGILGEIGNAAVKTLLYSLCNQVDKAYLKNPDATLDIVEPILDKLLTIEVSDYPSTAFKDTLGFGSTGEKGTLGDLASTVLAYHYTNNEDPNSDKFLMSALDRFYNGENAEVIVDTLLDVVLNDLLQDTILKNIKIDPVSWGINSEMGDIIASLTGLIDGLLGTNGFPEIGVSDIISVLLLSGILGGDKLSDVVYSLLDEYLTQSQYDIIDGEFYRILKDLTHDNDPAYMVDFEGTVNYNGKVAVPLSQDNLRLPSHIAVTFGEDAATSRNISYFTKYSLTDTDIQIVPYSENPDFSKGTTVDVNIDTTCEIDAEREYYAINLGFIGIITHKMEVNRHTIEITGLSEGTKYCYRVGNAERGWWSDIGVIDTADNTNAFSFFHMTDPQSVTEKQYAENWAVTLDTAFTNHKDSDFILNTGDLVDNGNEFMEWKRMFNTAADTLMDTVMMSASGNHEERGDNALVNNFVFSNLPEQDTATGVYYSFDYNTAHVAVLNSNDLNDNGGLSDAQIQWLTEDMNASEKAWKFVALHKAPYSNGSHFDDEDVAAIRAQLATLMPELDIDIVFQGHDHVYMRTDVMNNNAVVETETQALKYNGLEYVSKISPDGTIYSINGTAGCKHYEPKADSETAGAFPTGETVVSLDIPSYSYIQIDGGNLYFDSYAVNGDGSEERIDNFAISKVVTLEDGTIIDGTNSDNVVEDNNGGSNDVIGDITDTFRQNPVFSYVAVAGVALVLVAGVVVTVIVRRRREEA